MFSINVLGHNFEVASVWSTGHVLSAVEAVALNKARASAIRNNLTAKLNGIAKKHGEGKLENVPAEILNEELASYEDYIAAYEFSTREVAPSVDPIEKEALKLAGAAVRVAIKAKGKKADAETVARFARELLDHAEKGAKFWHQARTNVEFAKATVLSSLGLED